MKHDLLSTRRWSEYCTDFQLQGDLLLYGFHIMSRIHCSAGSLSDAGRLRGLRIPPLIAVSQAHGCLGWSRLLQPVVAQGELHTQGLLRLQSMWQGLDISLSTFLRECSDRN